MNRLRLVVVLIVLGSAAGAQTASPAGLTNIGVAAAVRGAVRAAAPNQVGRVIGSGQPVFLNDHVTTGADGRLQLLLLDQTTFTIGPNSDMVLDQFVYDPKTNAGSLSASILKGVFRFVTGKIAQRRPSSMRVTLPVGTIGIRGTMVAGKLDGRNAYVALIGPGQDNNAQERPGGITVFNQFGSTNVNASGYGVTITDGGKPSRAFRFSALQLDGILNELGVHHTAGVGGPDNASGNSGDQLAQGGINYRDWQNLNIFNQGVNETSGFASQQASSGVDNWSDLLAIPSGQVGYSGTGSITACSGSGCSGVGSTFSFGVDVDFGGRTIGNGGSYITISGSESTFDTTYGINSIGYAGRSGQATYTMSASDVSWQDGGNSAGTVLKFLKSAGQPAGAMQMILNYTNTGVNLSGSGTGPKGAYIPAG
jgi:hypothetical protein